MVMLVYSAGQSTIPTRGKYESWSSSAAGPRTTRINLSRVERASYELAARRGRSEFVLHISRPAEIENRGVVPGVHKLYSLAAIYHLDPQDILRWYDVLLEECFHDGSTVQSPQTHLLAPPTSLQIPMRFDPAFDPRRTEFLSRMVEEWGHFEGVLTNGHGRNVYGYIGMSDRRMMPLLRPGSIVLVMPQSARSMMATGLLSMTGRCILWKCVKVTAADGSIRTVPGWSCSPTRSRIACPKCGVCRKKQKS